MHWWDLDAVADIERDLFGATAWTREQFYSELATAGRWIQVALGPDDRPLGYVDVAVQGRDADLMTIAVARPAQGKGVGATLLRLALDHATDAGARHMFLEVRADNSAREFYEDHGFTAIDLRRAYYPDDADAVIMRTLLKGDNGHHAEG